jgi:drug/metabolite transporter (DMT)-like permease
MTHQRAVWLMVLATLFWSTAGVVTRQLQVTSNGFEITFWRSAFNAVALVIFFTLTQGAGNLWRALQKSDRVLWLSGICWGAMYVSFMVAITLTTVANVLITMALMPLFTALLARFFLRHQLPGRTWLAIAVTGLGMVWMYARASGGSHAMGLGSLVALGVPLSASINWSLLQAHQASAQSAAALIEEGASGTAVVVKALTPDRDLRLAILIGAVLSALVTLPLAMPFHVNAHDVSWLAFLGVFQLAVPSTLLVMASRALSAPEVSLLALLEVIFGVLWAWWGAGEVPSADTLVGGALVLLALAGNEAWALREAIERRPSVVSGCDSK